MAFLLQRLIEAFGGGDGTSGGGGDGDDSKQKKAPSGAADVRVALRFARQRQRREHRGQLRIHGLALKELCRSAFVIHAIRNSCLIVRCKSSVSHS